MPARALRPGVAAALVFVASGAVLVLEILGIRLLAPYVGLTLETTTAIIGTVLAGIAAGAAIGGRLADRVDPRLLVPELLAGGGLLAVATVPLVRVLGEAMAGGGDEGALIIAFVALLPPATVLSAVTPVVAKLQLHDLAATGSVVGRLSAWATAGGLAGTFATGFVIVPLVPTDVTVFAVGGVLLALGTVLAVRARIRSRGAATTVLVVAVVVGTATVAAGSPCDVESIYHCARVVEDDARPGGRTLVLDDLRHSYVDLDDPRHLEFAYTRWIGDVIDAAAAPGTPLDGVFLGGGGFTLPRYLTATRPGSRARVLEVDAAIVDLARERLGLRTGADLQVRLGDARVTLRNEPGDSADLVVGDAFGGRSIPWHLATVEFAEEIRRVLRPDGVYALNVIDQGSLALLRAEAATLQEVFEHVVLLTGTDAAGRPIGGNAVLVATDGRVPEGLVATAMGERKLAAIADDSEPLRDDHAPADQLLTPLA